MKKILSTFLLIALLVLPFGNTAQAVSGKLLYGAGGGGGGYGSGGATGGGGAGGVIYDGAFNFTAKTYVVVIGDGGAAGISASRYGKNGSNTTFTDATTTTGGGGGGADPTRDVGGTGGSGGGSVFVTTVATTTSSAQGNNGGAGDGGTNNGGGGGGKGAVGTSVIAGNNTGRAGGTGIADASVGNLLTHASAGVGGCIGGGGGGGTNNASPNTGGTATCGGGAGGGYNSVAPTAGTANTSGGGGGCYSGCTSSVAGGSGFAIAEFPTASFTFTYSGTYTTGTSGSDTWVFMKTSGNLVLSSSTPATVSPFDFITFE